MIDFNFLLSKINNKIANKFICNFLSAKFSMTEKLQLSNSRDKHEHVNYFDQPLVSVYIPTYNRSSILLSKSLPSLLKQTYKNMEIIIIGDRCTDDTERKINEINDTRIKFKNINYAHKPMPKNKKYMWLAGEVMAANIALKKSSGLWLARLDDDEEWINENHIQIMLEHAKKNDSEFVSAANSMNEKIIYGQKALSDYYLTKKVYSKNISNDIFIGGHSTFFYKSYLKFFKYNSQCWRKNWNKVNDADLVNRMIKADVKITYLNKAMTKINKINTPVEIRNETKD